jgi:hypothetical protein
VTKYDDLRIKSQRLGDATADADAAEAGLKETVRGLLDGFPMRSLFIIVTEAEAVFRERQAEREYVTDPADPLPEYGKRVSHA